MYGVCRHLALPDENHAVIGQEQDLGSDLVAGRGMVDTKGVARGKTGPEQAPANAGAVFVNHIVLPDHAAARRTQGQGRHHLVAGDVAQNRKFRPLIGDGILSEQRHRKGKERTPGAEILGNSE